MNQENAELKRKLTEISKDNNLLKEELSKLQENHNFQVNFILHNKILMNKLENNI